MKRGNRVCISAESAPPRFGIQHLGICPDAARRSESEQAVGGNGGNEHGVVLAWATAVRASRLPRHAAGLQSIGTRPFSMRS